MNSSRPGAAARPFMGREDVIAQLDAELVRALYGPGRAIVLHGPAGCGRSALVRRFVAAARRRHPRLRSAIGDAADPERPAWAQLAFNFTVGRRAGGVVRRSLREWIGVVPAIGSILAAIAETIRQLRPASTAAPHHMLGTGSTIDQVRTLLSFGAGDPRLIVLENLDAADPAELAGAFALVPRLAATRTLFIATCRSDHGRLPTAAAVLASEIERMMCGRIIGVPALTAVDVRAALTLTTGAPPPPEWEAWFDRVAPDTPRLLWQTVDRLVDAGLLRSDRRGWQWGMPPEQTPVVAAFSADERAAHSPHDLELLAAAGALGPRFDAARLARALGWPDTDVDDTLGRLARHGIVRLEETRADGDEFIDRYAFTRPTDAARWAIVP
ncbi:MAG: ATP-binding protein [Longimicrobiales bacterium]